MMVTNHLFPCNLYKILIINLNKFSKIIYVCFYLTIPKAQLYFIDQDDIYFFPYVLSPLSLLPLYGRGLTGNLLSWPVNIDIHNWLQRSCLYGVLCCMTSSGC